MPSIGKRLDGHGLTPFQKKVLIAACKIPYGETISYKQLARLSGNPRAYRAAGTALRKNPFPVEIPCHRVIKSDGSPGNYSGRGGERRKRQLINGELRGSAR